MHISEIETPALLVDAEIMERNLQRAAAYAASHNLRLRPHTKTHKTSELGRRQLELGAAGLTVAKVGEAEVMLGAGPQDLLVAYPVIGAAKLRRLAEVARRTRVTLSLDSAFAAQQLAEAAGDAGVSFGVLAEVDVGMGRVGVDPGRPLLNLAGEIQRLPGLSFEGIAFYPGHIKRPDPEGLLALEELDVMVRSMLDELGRAGIEARIVSGGSTPALFHSHSIGGLNEIRPGTYIFNDRNTVAAGACALEDCAASVMVTVVSTARPGQMIIDGGSKTFSSDRLGGSSEEAGFGHILEDPGAVIVKMNEEHGFVDIRGCSRAFRVGDRIRVIPNHICTAVNLHETICIVHGERVERVYKVEGRGKLQ